MKNYDFKLVYKKYDKKAQIFKSVVFALVFGIIITAFCGYFLGYRGFIVRGYSSEPYIHIDSLAIDCKVDFDELKVGDFITWSRSGNNYVTHQIVEINKEARTVTTSQQPAFDPSVTKDENITESQIKGKVLFSIPYLGGMIYSIKNLIISNGSFNILGIMLIVLIISTYYLFSKLIYTRVFILKEK